MTTITGATRRVTLLRHGHAVDHCPSGDFDRALDDRGQAEIEHAALELLAVTTLPTLILASPARRTRDSAAVLQRVWTTQATAEGVAVGGTPVELRFEPRLYLASVETLQDIIALNAAQQTHLLLVGHNPGLSDLLQQFNVHRALGTGDWHSLPLGSDA